MTDPKQLLDEVELRRRRTRRLVDSEWFTFAVLGAALLVGAVGGAGRAWALAAALLAAYVAIAIRWHGVHRAFPREGATSIPLAPFALSATIAVGALGLSAALEGDAAVVSVTAWTAAGCLAFWRWLASPSCLFLAGAVVLAGIAQLLLGPGRETLVYGLAFGAWAAVEWLRVGRRPR